MDLENLSTDELALLAAQEGCLPTHKFKKSGKLYIIINKQVQAFNNLFLFLRLDKKNKK